MTKRLAVLILGVAMSMGLTFRTSIISMARFQDDKMDSQEKGKMKSDKMEKKDKMVKKSKKHKKEKMGKMEKMDDKSKMDDKK